jgi:hypothetical protein
MRCPPTAPHHHTSSLQLQQQLLLSCQQAVCGGRAAGRVLTHAHLQGKMRSLDGPACTACRGAQRCNHRLRKGPATHVPGVEGKANMFDTAHQSST